MRKQHFLLSILLVQLISFGTVAKAQRPPIRWSKILPADTSLKVYNKAPKASAVVLCDYGIADIGPRTMYTRHVRIKILNNEGLRYAKVEIPYQHFNDYRVISGLKAQTINISPEGKKVTSRVKPNDIEEVVTGTNWERKKVFTFPDVKPGSIIEYKYSVYSLDLVRLQDWHFQTTIPTLWSEYRVYIPRRFDYLVTFQKGRALDIEEQKAFAEKLQWLYDTRQAKARNELSKKKYLLYESAKGTAKVYYGQGEAFTFTMNDIPAFEPQRGILALTDFFPTVKVHMFNTEGYNNFFYRRILSASKEDFDWNNPRSEYMRYYRGFVLYSLPTWDEAVNYWLTSENFGGRLRKEVDAKPLDGTDQPEFTKIKSIYQYVKNNVTWDGTYNMYAFRNLNNVLNKKSGNSGEMNLLLIALLRQSGIKAEPVLVRTLDLGRIENIYPRFRQFNHVVAQVETGDRTLYLDASGKNSSFDNLPWNVNHANGFLVTRKNYNWVDVVKPEKLLVPASLTDI